MESSSVSSDANTSVFCSPDGSTEPPKTEKIKTSVSVSSLAEKFEKGGDSIKLEDSPINQNGVFEVNCTASDSSVEAKDSNFRNKKEIEDISKNVSSSSETGSNDKETDQSACKETGEKSEPQSRDSAKDSVPASQESKDSTKPLALQSASGISDNGGSSEEVNSEISQKFKAVEERVAYFVEKISEVSKNSIRTDNSGISPTKEADEVSQTSDIPRKLSLKDLEQSFVAALNIENFKENERTTSAALSVPSIEITQASDREDTSSEDSEETKSKSKASKTETKAPLQNMEFSDDKNTTEPTPSTSTAPQCERIDETEVSAEERKAFFYISSSDLPAGLVNDTLESSDELRQRPVNQPERTENFFTPQPETRSPSCLCSKSIHGVISLTSFIVAILGFILYNLANEGKVPDFCHYLGLVVAIIAGTTGAFSCFCFTFLEAFPRMVIPGYERLVDVENAPSNERNANIQVQSLDYESWSSEKERAFRRQNGMSSTRTSTNSLTGTPSDRRELIEKAEKLKEEVVGLLDSFSNMISNLEESDDISEIESGTVNKQD